MGSIIGLLVVTYFCYHAVQGDRGLLAHARLTEEIARARAVLDTLTAEEAALQARVERLSPQGLDRDLLDERARGMFNRIRPEERVSLWADLLPESGSTADPAPPPRDPALRAAGGGAQAGESGGR